MKIYLAGPDVFREDPTAHFEQLKALCSKYGFEGCAPLDNEMKNPTSPSIFMSNVDLIEDCDVIIANLTPFRGACIDDGTAWEIGCGYGIGKTVLGYTDTSKTLVERTKENCVISSEFPQVEDFAPNCVNLMIQESVSFIGEDFEDCLEFLSGIYGSGIPELGETYHYFDDGKITLNRKDDVEITKIVPFNKASDDILGVWREDSENCDWLYAKETDYFIFGHLKGVNEDVIFVRTLNNGWFSLGWWAGRLDIDGKLNERLEEKLKL